MKRSPASLRFQAIAAGTCAMLALTASAQNNNDWFLRQQQMQQQEATRRQHAEQQRRMEEERRRVQEHQRREQQRMLEEQRRRQLEELRRQQEAQRERIRREQAAQRQRDHALRNQQGRDRQSLSARQQGPNKDMARGTGVAPGSNRAILANGRLARPLTPGEIQRGFTGRVTPDGRALIKVQNRVFTVPASRIAGLSARLARLKASTSLSTRHQEWLRDLAQKLATSPKAASVASRREAAKAARARNQLRLDKVKLVDHDALAAKHALANRPVPGSSEKLRKQPGVATYNGKLPHVTSTQWLAGRNSVPVPAQIAQRLSGRRFKTFSRFRAAFWKEVAADPVLRQAFDGESLASMRAGKAPSVAIDQRRGKRAVYELDHHHEIQDGGGTYDLNNIRIKTPNAHVRKISRDFNLSSGAN